MTFTSFGGNALMNVQNNGVNSVSIDLPNYTPGNLEINHNPRNGLPYFNTALFTERFGYPRRCQAALFLRTGNRQLRSPMHRMVRLPLAPRLHRDRHQ